MTDPFHHARKRFLKPVELSFHQLGFGVDNHIEAAGAGRAKFMFPQNLSDPPFASITNHGAAYFSGNGDSISPLVGVVLQKERRKEGGMNFVASLINPAKLLAVAQRVHQ